MATQLFHVDFRMDTDTDPTTVMATVKGPTLSMEVTAVTQEQVIDLINLVMPQFLQDVQRGPMAAAKMIKADVHYAWVQPGVRAVFQGSVVTIVEAAKKLGGGLPILQAKIEFADGSQRNVNCSSLSLDASVVRAK